VNKGYALDWHCLRRRRQRYEAEVTRNAPLKHAILVRWNRRSSWMWINRASSWRFYRERRRAFYAALFGVSKWWEFVKLEDATRDGRG
jgi:hypothetical protein